MNYSKLYNDIVLNRLNNPYKGYTETHHILPKSMGGTNESSNLVKLSAREHFICHWLLYKIYKNQAMACAWNAMCLDKFDARYTSHSFKYAREAHSKALSVRNIGNSYASREFTEEHKKRISEGLKGKPKTKEHIANLRKPKSSTENMGKSHRKQVLCIETGKIYKSVKDASKQMGIHKDAISNCARGKTKTSGGYTWKYVQQSN